MSESTIYQFEVSYASRHPHAEDHKVTLSVSAHNREHARARAETYVQDLIGIDPTISTDEIRPPRAQTPLAVLYCHEDGSPDERSEIISEACKLESGALDGALEDGPGAYERNSDRALAMALDTISGHGFADDEAGSVEFGLHAARVGRYVLWIDNQGFKTVQTFTSADDAQYALDAENAYQGAPEETRARISELQTEISEARRLGRDPQKQLCELASLLDI